MLTLTPPTALKVPQQDMSKDAAWSYAYYYFWGTRYVIIGTQFAKKLQKKSLGKWMGNPLKKKKIYPFSPVTTYLSPQ